MKPLTQRVLFRPDGTVAEIEANDGSLNLVVQSGRRVTVNGAKILTADDVAQAVADGVTAALQNLGKAIE